MPRKAGRGWELTGPYRWTDPVELQPSGWEDSGRDGLGGVESHPQPAFRTSFPSLIPFLFLPTMFWKPLRCSHSSGEEMAFGES